MSWMQTFSGKRFEPLNPDSTKLDILDIAHALALKCRFAGHCTQFYSVAEHCVRGSYLVPPGHALQFLLHDASEAYLTDMVRPIKHLFPDFCEVEERLQREIYKWAGLSEDEPSCIKDADNTMLVTERRDLLVPMSWDRVPPYEPLADKIEPWNWEKAKTNFLLRYIELKGAK